VLLGGPLDLSVDYDRRLAVGEAWGLQQMMQPVYKLRAFIGMLVQLGRWSRW
jgi:hypothetical protein